LTRKPFCAAVTVNVLGRRHGTSFRSHSLGCDLKWPTDRRAQEAEYWLDAES